MVDWLEPYDRRRYCYPGPIQPAQHPVFQQLSPWRGLRPAGFAVDFVGQLTDVKFVHGFNVESRQAAAPTTCSYPQPNDENFEWLALLEALLEAPQGGTFTMLELGAGYGRWLVGAACAARARRPDLKVRLVGVEAEPTHFGWLQQHFRNNGLDPAEHCLKQGAVMARSGHTYLMFGTDPAEWYGQYATNDPDLKESHYPDSRAERVAAVGINDLLREHEYIDLIDMDIQAAELEVIPAGIKEMTRRVRRVHVESHSSGIHEVVGRTLARAGWRCEAAYDGARSNPTVFGDVSFHGGVHYWVNPRSPLERLARKVTARLGLRLR